MDLIKHPSRTLLCGRSQMGKTTLGVLIVVEQLIPDLDRIILISATPDQSTYDPIRKYIQKNDIIYNITKDTIKQIFDDIKHLYEVCKAKGVPPQRTLIFMDDLAGSGLMHGGRRGAFANLAIQTPHWSLSIIVVSHQPTNTDPNFRNNAENVIVFPPDGEEELVWLRKSYQSLAMKNITMRDILLYAWSGSKSGDISEWGKHFLFIHAQPRSHTRFFVDFNREITIH